MSRPLEPKGELSLPAGLTTSSNATESLSDGAPTPPSDTETHEPFANLKMDERHFEDSKKRDERKAQLVMGPPLGGAGAGAGAGGAEQLQGNNNETLIEGQVLAENEEILADLEDDATDLELTHLRLRSLRGLGLERFTKVQVSAFRTSPRRCGRV
jgi:protein phosphatase 1 regulatory subunit 7